MSVPERFSSARLLFPWLRFRVWVGEIIRLSDLQITLFWAGVIGFSGAVVSVGFRRLTGAVHFFLTHQNGGYVESMQMLPAGHRLAIPALGGLLAGLTMVIGVRWTRKNSSTDYMEAIMLGDGIVPARLSLVKSLSAMFSIASGGSIGREGPLVQLSAMLASLIGRLRNRPTLQLRLFVACGAAAGIASAYNAPIGGALFVAEIILQSLAMESFGPLVFSSVVATLTVRQLLTEGPLFEIPPVHMSSNWEIIPHALLGLVAGLAAPPFLHLLRASETAFAQLRAPVIVRLMLGGLIVGGLAIWHPEVCGNGYSVVNQILAGDLLWQAIVSILVFKLVATAATFGSGAVGGVFTPTLFVGACLGSLAAHLAQLLWPAAAFRPEAFIVVGMGAFLAGTTHAPIMAIIMLFEMTLDYEIILPLMLACVISHYASLSFEKRSIYAESLLRKGGGRYQQRLADLRVIDLMKSSPASVGEAAGFQEIAEFFISHRFNYLYVVGANSRFLGVIALHDIKSYLDQRELAELVIARDLLREPFPTITPYEGVSAALDRFAEHEGERLPVVEDEMGKKLIGSISKTDLILALAERKKAPAETDELTASSAASLP